MARSRRPVLVLAALVGALLLGGCQSTSVTCSSGRCSISFGGGEGTTTITGSQMGSAMQSIPVTWDGTSNGSARLTVLSDQGTCTQGQTLVLGGFSVTCTKVTDQDLDLTVRHA